ncbi:thioredoxin fold domain-containing protein [Candidatus Saccharibacteria bacterium]|nr:thioredoxin fold domain-containing protein [Candidatus Saccharibacteria bacterium]
MPVIESTSDNFSKHSKSGYAFVDFNADWCGPCQILGPIFDSLAEDYESCPSLKFLSVNIDVSPELAEEFGVSGIPCLVLLKDGEEIARSVGVVPKRKLEKILKKALAV